MNSLYMFFLIIFFCFNSVFGITYCDSIEIQLIPIGKEYDGEDIKVELKLINKSNNIINIYNWRKSTITKAINIFLHFYISKDDTVVLDYSYAGPSVLLPYKNDYFAIKPGEDYSEIIHLNEYYKILKNSSNTMNKIWPSGEYEIYCKYEYTHNNNYKYGEELWQGTLYSNQIKIYVK